MLCYTSHGVFSFKLPTVAHTLPWLYHALQYSTMALPCSTILYHGSTMLSNTLPWLYHALQYSEILFCIAYSAKNTYSSFCTRPNCFSFYSSQPHFHAWTDSKPTYRQTGTNSLHPHIFCPFVGSWCTESSCVWNIESHHITVKAYDGHMTCHMIKKFSNEKVFPVNLNKVVMAPYWPGAWLKHSLPPMHYTIQITSETIYHHGASLSKQQTADLLTYHGTQQDLSLSTVTWAQ